MDWRLAVKRLVPGPALNRILLALPFLYKLSFVNYESNMDHEALLDLEEFLDDVIKVPGEVIECGSSRCGTSAILAAWILKRGGRKVIYACDSFEGFDPGELRRERDMGLTEVSNGAFASTSYSYVRAKLKALGLSEIVLAVKGYFRETLPSIAGPFCFALVDCDLEDSMTFCAQHLFEKLSPCGGLAFHDYTSNQYRGARRAVDRFVDQYLDRLTNLGLRRQIYFVRKNR